jgi:hypothetical protein
MVVPLHAVAAILLAGRRPWGFVLAAVANVKGAVYMPALAASALTAWAAGALDDPRQALLWVGIGGGAAVSLWAVLRAVPDRAETRTLERAISHSA